MVAKKKVQNRLPRIPSFLNRDKYIHSILFFLEKINNKYLGKTKLMKLLYFLDFGYYEIHEESITNDKYVWYPHGPVPSRADTILNYMEKKDLIERKMVKFDNRKQERYLPVEKFRASIFTAEELRSLEKIASFYEEYSTQEIEDEAHRDIPWLLSKPPEGEKVGRDYIDYELALYRHNSLPSEEDEKETEALAKSRKFRELIDKTIKEFKKD